MHVFDIHSLSEENVEPQCSHSKEYSCHRASVEGIIHLYVEITQKSGT